jgi:hypothetical protein
VAQSARLSADQAPALERDYADVIQRGWVNIHPASEGQVTLEWTPTGRAGFVEAWREGVAEERLHAFLHMVLPEVPHALSASIFHGGFSTELGTVYVVAQEGSTRGGNLLTFLGTRPNGETLMAIVAASRDGAAIVSHWWEGLIRGEGTQIRLRPAVTTAAVRKATERVCNWLEPWILAGVDVTPVDANSKGPADLWRRLRGLPCLCGSRRKLGKCHPG